MRRCNTGKFSTFIQSIIDFTLDLYSLPRTIRFTLDNLDFTLDNNLLWFHLGQYEFYLGQYGFHIGSMQKLMQMNWSEAQSQLNHARSLLEGSWVEVFMLGRPSFDFGNGKSSVLSWGHFDLGTFRW